MHWAQFFLRSGRQFIWVRSGPNPDIRREAITREVSTAGAARSDELAQRFSVSLETIRRDLLALERQGGLRRVFGGARGAGGARRQALLRGARCPAAAPKSRRWPGWRWA